MTEFHYEGIEPRKLALFLLVYFWFVCFRYSHTAHVVDENLFLIGGVIPNSSHPAGVVVLNLKNLTWKSYTLPVGFTSSALSFFSDFPSFLP